ncbi:MAG: cardiolipin synthase [Ichthyobacteriaceae bacterium]|nr:cardiolipin synthase [Ichthyobacteriaceae bacterium]
MEIILAYDFGVLEYTVYGVYSIIVIYTLYKIVSDTYDTTKTIFYITIVLAFPMVGIYIYYALGVNYRKYRIYSKKIKINNNLQTQINSLYAEQMKSMESIPKEMFGDFYSLAYFLLNDAKELLGYNKLNLLNNGEVKFPRLFNDLKKAKKYIHIEYYMWENGIIGNQLKDILISKSKEGVKIRVIYDAFGSQGIGGKMVEDMQAVGIKIFPILQVKLVAFASRMNHRDHRKIVVIDGLIGYIGGVNISDRYDNRYNNGEYWRDTHLRIEGFTVNNLQHHFIANWNYCSDEKLVANHEFFVYDNYWNSKNIRDLTQIVVGGPDYKRSYILYAFFKIFTLAKKRLFITTPYFIPDESVLLALKQAALGGVDVRLIVPYVPDSRLVGSATRYYLQFLLNAGVRVYLYYKGFIHSKTVVADQFVSVIGTANLDIRSFSLNYEANAIVYSKEVAIKLEGTFYEDLRYCKELEYNEWMKTSRIKKFEYNIARLLSSFL